MLVFVFLRLRFRFELLQLLQHLYRIALFEIAADAHANTIIDRVVCGSGAC